MALVTDVFTGKSFSEALILASTNPQYDKRLFIDLRVQYMKIPNSEHVENMLCTSVLTFRTIYVHNMFWACNFYVLNLQFNEQSFAILWVSWCKNKCFWKRFTCKIIIIAYKFAETLLILEHHKHFLKSDDKLIGPHTVNIYTTETLVIIFQELLQVLFFQKRLFLHQLTHNMAKDCSLNYKFSTRKLQAQNMLCT